MYATVSCCSMVELLKGLTRIAPEPFTQLKLERYENFYLIIGLIGLAVMGENLILNMTSKGLTLRLY